MKVLGSVEVNPWKGGRETRLILFILASPLVSFMGKNSLSLFSTIAWVGEVGSSSSPIGSSKNLGF